MGGLMNMRRLDADPFEDGMIVTLVRRDGQWDGRLIRDGATLHTVRNSSPTTSLWALTDFARRAQHAAREEGKK